jgi:hypothetical protein
MPIQLFFARRIFRLTKQPLVTIVISVLAIVSFGACLELFSLHKLLTFLHQAGGLWTTVKIVIVKLFSRKPEFVRSALVWFLAASVADVIITVIGRGG